MLWPREGSCLWPWHRGWGTLPSAQSVPAASWRQRQLQLTCTQLHLLPAWGLTHLPNNRRERKGCLAQERKRPHLTAVEGKHGQAGGSSGLSFQPEAPAFAVPVGGWGRRRASGRSGPQCPRSIPSGDGGPGSRSRRSRAAAGTGQGLHGLGDLLPQQDWSEPPDTGPIGTARAFWAVRVPSRILLSTSVARGGSGRPDAQPAGPQPCVGREGGGRGVGLGPVDRRTSGRWDAKLCTALQWGRTVTPGPGFRASRGHHRW